MDTVPENSSALRAKMTEAYEKAFEIAVRSGFVDTKEYEQAFRELFIDEHLDPCVDVEGDIYAVFAMDHKGSGTKEPFIGALDEAVFFQLRMLLQLELDNLYFAKEHGREFGAPDDFLADKAISLSLLQAEALNLNVSEAELLDIWASEVRDDCLDVITFNEGFGSVAHPALLNVGIELRDGRNVCVMSVYVDEDENIPNPELSGFIFEVSSLARSVNKADLTTPVELDSE